MMRTITIEVPDNVAASLEAMPTEERNNFAVAALSAALEQEKEDEEIQGDFVEAEVPAEELARREAALAAFRRFSRPRGRETGYVSLEDMRRVNLYADDPHKDR
jgi:hypothetical protein